MSRGDQSPTGGAAVPGRSRVLVVSLIVLALVSAVSAVVILLDEAPPSVQAVRYLPAEASAVTFFDRDSWADRSGVGDIGHHPSSAEVETYAEALNDAYQDTPLAGVFVQTSDFPITDVDVDWSAAAYGGRALPDTRWQILRIDDAVDLSALGAELEEAGYEQAGAVAGRPTYRAPQVEDSENSDLLAGGIPEDLREVTILEDEHLLVTAGAEGVVEVVNGDRESFADTDAGSLAERVAGSEYFLLTAHDGLRCPPPPDSESDDPEVTKLLSALGDLGRPDAAAVTVNAVDDQEVVTAVLQLPNAEAARSDADARRRYIPLAKDPRSFKPLSELIELESVRSEGDFVVVEFDYRGDEDAATAHSLEFAGPGAGITACTTPAVDSG